MHLSIHHISKKIMSICSAGSNKKLILPIIIKVPQSHSFILREFHIVLLPLQMTGMPVMY